MPNILDSLNWALKIANDNSHGYDQKHRQSPDYDCSSLVANALKKGGFDISPDSYTGNLYTRMKKAGFVEVPIDAERLSGDVFLTPGHHVVMCVDGKRIVHASLNEKGEITGGKTGDQTGKEICIRNFYTPSYGWKYHLRYKDVKQPDSTPKIVYTIPKLLTDIADGVYGNKDKRKENIEKMGLDYKTVQYLVNCMLNGGNYNA